MGCHPAFPIGIGMFLFITSLLIPFLLSRAIDYKISSKFIIRPDSEMLEKFIEPSSIMHLQVRFFNVTNSEAILKGKVPKLEEIGPYTYKQVKRKVNLKFNHAVGTVSYNPIVYYYFVPELSVGFESDVITTINPLFVTIAKIADTHPGYVRGPAEFGSRPFMTHLASELLFTGYEFFKEFYNHTRFGRTGFMYMKNGTMSGRIEVYTGELDMNEYQNVLSYQESASLSYWQNEECDMLNGTDGALYPRPITDSRIYLFSADLCRSIYAVYEKEVYMGPLSLRRYILPKELLAKSPENECFCTDNFTCRDSMLDVSGCRDAPIVISMPHFYQGSILDRNKVMGLNPVKEIHETHLDIEPTTGIAMRVNKRIQINIPLRKYGQFPLLGNITELIFPILWMNERDQASMQQVSDLHRSLHLPQLMMKYGPFAAFGLGLVCFIVGSFLTCIRRNKKKLVANRNARRMVLLI